MKHLTPMKAIRAFCSSCIYDAGSHGNGSELQQIENCTSNDCPLYEYRPLTGETREKLKQKRLLAMTPSERMAYDKRAEKSRLNMQKMRDKA